MKKRFVLGGLIALIAVDLCADVVPQSVHTIVKPLYGYRADNSPGRIVSVQLKGKELNGEVWVDVAYKKIKDTSVYQVNAQDSTTVDVLLPSALPMDKTVTVNLTVRGKDAKVTKKVTVDPMRQWTVYLYNHSHVDIGYTNTHKNIELLHKTNVLEGMKLGRETAGHVEGARFVWNPEVSWPLERLWVQHPEKRTEVIEALQKGYLSLDASYLNLNTSICSDEELFHVFKFSREMQKMSGVPSDVFQQFDIPGISWGLIPVMVQEGIKYVVSWPNTDRGGMPIAII